MLKKLRRGQTKLHGYKLTCGLLTRSSIYETVNGSYEIVNR